MNTLTPLLGAAFVIGLDATALGLPITAAQEEQVVGADEAPVAPLVRACAALREWAASERPATEAEESGERPTIHSEVAAWLKDLRSSAPVAGGDEWREAKPAKSLLELAVDSSQAGRQMLAVLASDLAPFAPTPRMERALLAAAVRIAEPLAHGAQPETARQRWCAKLSGWVDRIEQLTAGNPASSNGTSFVEQARQRMALLGIGQEVPPFLARDTAGNEVRASDFTGKVVLYRFWSSESPASIAAHHRDNALLRSRWDEPFELVGVSGHESRDEHLLLLADHDFGGTQVFDGPISVELIDALAKAGQPATIALGTTSTAMGSWADPIPGSSFVIDSRGVIRGRDLAGPELERLIDDLIVEHRTRLREIRLTGRSGH